MLINKKCPPPNFSMYSLSKYREREIWPWYNFTMAFTAPQQHFTPYCHTAVFSAHSLLTYSGNRCNPLYPMENTFVKPIKNISFFLYIHSLAARTCWGRPHWRKLPQLHCESARYPPPGLALGETSPRSTAWCTYNNFWLHAVILYGTKYVICLFASKLRFRICPPNGKNSGGCIGFCFSFQVYCPTVRAYCTVGTYSILPCRPIHPAGYRVGTCLKPAHSTFKPILFCFGVWSVRVMCTST